MNETSNWLVHDHRKYDAALDECELAAGAGEWKEAIRQFRDLVEDLKVHMQMEDAVIYPMLEQQSNDPHGEIAELRDEHEDLERLLRDLHRVIKVRDLDHFLDSLVPLHRAMRQHNAHEEKVFQRFSGDSALLSQREEVLARLRAVEARRGRRVWDF